MKRSRILLFASLFCILSVGKFWGDTLRGETIGTLSPCWRGIGAVKELFGSKKRTNGAKVIYRTPSLWNSVLWIDRGVGEVDLHSPVMKGSSLIGVVDYVGKRQSRVRLITDSSLSVAVRVSRGADPHRKVVEDVEQLLSDLQLFGKEDCETLNQEALKALKALKEAYSRGSERRLLAKGELHGSSSPLWKRRGQLLKGVGFNLDFADDHSSAMDLRSGDIIGYSDLLVTSGLDGLFPEGLIVGVVTHIDLLEEGDYYYTIEAKPSSGNLDDLAYVELLEPLGFDPQDLPPTWSRR